MINPLVSVIIPTYNRPDTVLRLLGSLAGQTLPPDRYEVVVVDDGSTYDPAQISNHPFPFAWHYERQPNQGATVARNHGATLSQGEILVFIDDDVTVSPPTLAALAELCQRESRAVVLGTLIARSPQDKITPFTQEAIAVANASPHSGTTGTADRELHFSWCNTQLLAVRRADFAALGGLQDPTGGWPNWDDVDFGYRAHLSGFRLLQSGTAQGIHWDYSLTDLAAACRRWQRASQSAVRLFQVHPALQAEIPMLWDKTPVVWGEDGLGLVGRKLARQVMAWGPVLWGMETAVSLLERFYPTLTVLRPFYLWIQGSYMVRGYRDGLRAPHPAPTPGKPTTSITRP